jgi:Ca2+-binding RTX toxin-like protein
VAQEIHLASGATEADIMRALGTIESGGTVILPADETIKISKGLVADVSARSITLDLNGSTLQQAGGVTVVMAKGQQMPAQNVALGTDGHGNTTISYDKMPADLKVGGWIKVVSDNALPGDKIESGLTTLMGQALQVASIDGNTVTFKGALIDQSNYTANVRAASYQSGEFTVKNGEIVGDSSLSKSTPPLVQVRDAISPHVENLSIHDGVGYGVSVANSVNASVHDVSIMNLKDGALLGIAIQSASSTGTTVQGLYAENVTHAADSNAAATVAGAKYLAQYGADIGFSVSDAVAQGTRNFAYSWHSESVNGHYENVQAFDSFGFMTARGVGGSMSNSGGASNERGVMFYEWGHGDSRGITLDNINLKETGNYSVISLENPLNNKITNSTLESYKLDNLAGKDAVTISNTSFTKAGADANDTIIGAAANDLLLGGKGNDTISGGAGHDYIWGGVGADVLTGGEGRDRFAYHSLAEGGDTITDFQAGRGGDVIDLSVMAAKFGWGNVDPVDAGFARFVQDGANVLVQVDQNGGGDSFVTIATLQNVDVSRLTHGNFHTSLEAPDPLEQPLPPPPPAPVADTAPIPVADSAPSTEQASSQAPSTDQASPQPESSHQAAAEQVSAAPPPVVPVNETLTGDDTANVIYGHDGNDSLYGLGGNDVLFGGDGDDRVNGGDGDDLLDGGKGADTLIGGGGYDTVTYASATTGVTADLSNDANNAGGAAGDRFSSIERLTGSDFADTLIGDQRNNVLDGGASDDRVSGGGGADTLIGGAGNDWLDGGALKDLLTGGAGADRFYFANAAEAGDTISDFQIGQDKIVLSAAGFGIAPNQHVTFESTDNLRLLAGSAAYTASNGPTLLYDSSTGRLLFDHDGNGQEKAQLVAVLTNAPKITFDDFLII